MAKFYTPTKISENIRETPEGYLLCLSVPIARTGWQDYGPGETPIETGPDGIVKIYRSKEEVFRPQTIASFTGKSITIRHPSEFVSPKNWQELSYGIAQNIRAADEKDEDGNECLLADLLVTDDMAIGLVKNGLREVSCGYEAEYEQTGKGKGRQFNIIGNHIALVEQGRAGSTYAINDHKGKVIMSVLKKLAEQMKNLGKTMDEAAANTSSFSKEEGNKVVNDQDSYDELVKAVKDLGEKVDSMSKGKDEDKEDKEKKDGKDEFKKEDKKESKDDDQEEMTIENRIKALEAAVAKMLQNMSGDEESESEDEDAEESDMSGDEDKDKGEDEEESESESEDEDKEDKDQKKMGDTALAEILAPGIKVSKKEDLKVKSLKEAYKTAEGKKVIDALTGGATPAYDSKEQVNLLFNAAGNMIKLKRGTGLESTKAGFEAFDNKKEVMTAEKMNEVNAAHWARK